MVAAEEARARPGKSSTRREWEGGAGRASDDRLDATSTAVVDPYTSPLRQLGLYAESTKVAIPRLSNEEAEHT
eukprot:6184410-Pleurochrysis_carterae.AAC.1